MGRLAQLAAALTIGLLAGCEPTESPERKEPFQPSQPPAGYIEDRMKDRTDPPKAPSRP